ncbi:hypothetical protein [Legionella jamestowniensis]|nr:hypothetical protein [Legionella jamestowniensis]
MKFFAHAQMKDLAEVGEKKALGYLPLETIRNAGFDAFHVSRFLQKNGLTVFIIPAPLPEEIYAYDSTIEKFVHVQTKQTFEVIPRGNFLTIKSGALVAFDKKAIDAFLQEKKEFIYHENQQETNEDYKWPSEANAFVNMLFRKQASSSLMNHFIHCIYTSMPTAITSNVNRPEC